MTPISSHKATHPQSVKVLHKGIMAFPRQVAGEGEAKVFGHLIQLARDDPNGPHAVVSPDADIVLWTVLELN